MKNILLEEPWLEWAIEIQSIAQAGLTYGGTPYDHERYKRLRDLSAEMLSYKTDIPVEKVKDLFCNEEGYQTPKLETRGVVFKDDKILLARENEGKWCLPGGWVDVLESVGSNTVKEVKEETGVDVVASRVIAVQDRNKHNTPVFPHGICKVFVECELLGGDFIENIETTEIGYFDLDNLPELMEGKTTKSQIEMCFKAYKDSNWKVLFD